MSPHPFSGACVFIYFLKHRDLGDKGDKICGVEMEKSMLCDDIALNVAQEPAEKANKALFSHVNEDQERGAKRGDPQVPVLGRLQQMV